MKQSLLPHRVQKKPFLILVGFLPISLVCLITTSCEKKKEDPSVHLLRKIQAAQQVEMTQIENEIKAAGTDALAIAKWGEEKALLQSRMARTKEELRRVGGLDPEPAAGGGGGHH